MFFSRKSDSEPKPEPPALPVRPLPPSAQSPIGFETVIGPSCTLEGALRSSGNLRLDGTFGGTLEITGNILVGETAKIDADINARNISIAGMVRGNVTGKRVQLLRAARVWGDITAETLTTEEGAFIDGKISMTPPESRSAAQSAHEEPMPAQAAIPDEPPFGADLPDLAEETGLADDDRKAKNEPEDEGADDSTDD